MSFLYVKIYYGLSNTFHRYIHRPQLVAGMRDRLQTLGFRVDLVPVPFHNYCMLEVCGHEVFRCNVSLLKFNTAADRDPLCQKAVDAVLSAGPKFRRARVTLWLRSLIEDQIFTRGALYPKDYWPISVEDGEDMPPVECLIKECCDIYEKEGALPPIDCIINKCCDISHRKDIMVPPYKCLIGKCCHISHINVPPKECLVTKCCEMPKKKEYRHIPKKHIRPPPTECIVSKCCELDSKDEDSRSLSVNDAEIPPIQCIISKCCYNLDATDSDIPPAECLTSKVCCNISDKREAEMPPIECLKSVCCDVTNKKDELPLIDIPVKETEKVIRPRLSKVVEKARAPSKTSAELTPPPECIECCYKKDTVVPPIECRESKCCDKTATQLPPEECVKTKCCDISNKKYMKMPPIDCITSKCCETEK